MYRQLWFNRLSKIVVRLKCTPKQILVEYATLSVLLCPSSFRVPNDTKKKRWDEKVHRQAQRLTTVRALEEKPITFQLGDYVTKYEPFVS